MPMLFLFLLYIEADLLSSVGDTSKYSLDISSLAVLDAFGEDKHKVQDNKASDAAPKRRRQNRN